MSSLNRRQFGAVVIGSTIPVGAYLTRVEPSEASVSGELNIDSRQKDIQDDSGVTSAILDVSGTFEYDSDVQPSRIVVRLEVVDDDTTEQLSSKLYQSDIPTSDTKDYSFRANLFEHSSIAAGEISPSTNGETSSLDLRAILTIQIKADGEMLAEQQLADQFSVTVTKTSAGATLTVGGTGKVEIET